MTKVQVRGIHVDDDGLGIMMRVNGQIFSPVPVVLLDVNSGFKTVNATADSEFHHPSGGYTDVHYVLSEKLFPVDVVLATGITNEPTFADKPVSRVKNTFVSQETVYDYALTVSVDSTNGGYSASNYGLLESRQEHFNKVDSVFADLTDGAIKVAFADGANPALAITVKFEGLIILDQAGTDGALYDIRLEWSDANSRYELATNASLVALGTYLANVEGATIGFGITYHY